MAHEVGTDPRARAQLRGLSEAITGGRLEPVEAYLAAGGHPDLNERGTTLLMEACYFKQAVIVRRLLAAGADVNARTGADDTPLGYALRYPDFSPQPVDRGPGVRREIVRLLVEAGARVAPPKQEAAGAEARLMFKTPLQAAAALGDTELVALLLAAGAAPDGEDYGGTSALCEAVTRGQPAVVERLLAAGARVNPPVARPGRVPMQQAVSIGSSEIGMFIYKEEQAGRAPDPEVLAGMRATWTGILDRLVAAGGALGFVDGRGWTLLVDAINGGDPVILARVLDHGLDPNRVGAQGTTPLHFLAACRRMEEARLVPLAELLLARGAAREARDEAGKTPAELALDRGFTTLAARLAPARGP